MKLTEIRLSNRSPARISSVIPSLQHIQAQPGSVTSSRLVPEALGTTEQGALGNNNLCKILNLTEEFSSDRASPQG